MTSQNNECDLKKMPQKTFASPVAKLYTDPSDKGKLEEPQSKQEHRFASKPLKDAPKPSSQKQKGITSSTAIQTKCRKNGKQTKQRDYHLTDAQYDEIFRSVLQKPLQECMEISGMKDVSVEANKEQSLGRETLVASPTSKEGVSGKISKEDSEAMPLEAEKKEHPVRRKKKNNKFSQHNKEMEKNEKLEANNGGCKENRKGAPKKKVKGNTQVVMDQEEMQEEEEEKSDTGSSSCWCIVWVQCSYPNCQKWRQLPSDLDTSVLPDDWTCSQNPDLQYNSCNVPEETWSGSEKEVVYANYIQGSIVWAKQDGYPWWPGLIEPDPDIGEYFLFSSPMDAFPSKYHVTYFGSSVTRAWISASHLRKFHEPKGEENVLAKLKSKGEKKDLEKALQMAKEAEWISNKERIKMFGFLRRFNGKASPKHVKDVHISCKVPAKRFQETPKCDDKNVLRSRKHPKKLFPPMTVGNIKKQVNTKGLKKPFSVPQRNSAKTKHLSPCMDRNSTTFPYRAPSSQPDNKGHWSNIKTFPMAESKEMVSLEESNKAMAFDTDEEGTFSSPEMSVFAMKEKDCPEDFSLVLDEE